MTKNHIFLASLVGALPGALLVYFSVMVFINYGGGPTINYQAMVGVILALGATLVVIPPAILVLYPSPKAASKPAKKETPVAGAAEDEVEEIDEMEMEVEEEEAPKKGKKKK